MSEATGIEHSGTIDLPLMVAEPSKHAPNNSGTSLDFLVAQFLYYLKGTEYPRHKNGMAEFLRRQHMRLHSVRGEHHAGRRRAGGGGIETVPRLRAAESAGLGSDGAGVIGGNTRLSRQKSVGLRAAPKNQRFG